MGAPAGSASPGVTDPFAGGAAVRTRAPQSARRWWIVGVVLVAVAVLGI